VAVGLPFAVRLAAQQAPLVGYSVAGASVEQATESQAIARVSAAEASTFSRDLSREPHMSGTPAQARTRDYVIALMRQWGLETEVRAYSVYIPQPKSVHVWKLGQAPAGDSTELILAEDAVPGDSTTGSSQILTFNGYSGVGSGAGDVVYVNYGLIQDYAHLDSVGVSVAGKVVIARYGKSFRGIKAREAERHHAAALLIYSDPADDGYVKGDTYPEGPMRPPQGVQRGSVMNDDGDPSTPGYPSLPGVPRLAPEQMPLPHIPVVPISYRNAALLLGDLRGTGTVHGSAAASAAGSVAHFPDAWQGALPFRYHIGPGPTRARVSFDAETGQAAYHTIWNTYGIVRGTTHPEEMVLFGGHRDAWGPGASDNVSGVVTVLGAAHAIADEVRAGRRPARTIIFATWDAEEWGLEGSVEYVEQDSTRLAQSALAYFNVDMPADGPNFTGTGSPSLRSLLRDVARQVVDPAHPDSGAPLSVYARWRRTSVTPDTTEPAMEDPGGGSDFAGFSAHLGIPILEWGYGGNGGVYHSVYDDYAWESRFGDPGFVHHVASARIGVRLLLRMANADVVPFDYVEYAHTMRGYIAPIDSATRAHGWSVSTAALAQAIERMERAAAAFALARDSAIAAPGRHAAAFEAANRALLRVERALTRPEGLHDRSWYRSLIYAPDNDDGYADLALPSVNEAIRSGNRDLTAQEIADLAHRFDGATAALTAARSALRPPGS
jgi:N-acetylated-alpha-linked acidic dipeptidase